jgi:plastocyanin
MRSQSLTRRSRRATHNNSDNEDSEWKKQMSRRLWTAGLVAPIAIAIGLLITRPQNLNVHAQQGPASAEVKIDNFSFGPAAVTVAAGTTVTWTNRDDIPHTVVSDDKVFKSKVLDTDEKFAYTFIKPGTYPYFCSVHPKMTGKVIVE